MLSLQSLHSAASFQSFYQIFPKNTEQPKKTKKQKNSWQEMKEVVVFKGEHDGEEVRKNPNKQVKLIRSEPKSEELLPAATK